MIESKIHLHKSHSDLKEVRVNDQQAQYLANNFDQLRQFGIGANQHALDTIRRDLMDTNPVQIGSFTTATNQTPVQFLQAFLPGVIYNITRKRVISELCGESIIGSFEDEEVVIRTLELTGTPAPYTDHGNTRLAGFNKNYEQRRIVRFELGFEVGFLSSLRAAKDTLSEDREKRMAVIRALEIIRNSVGFNGYNYDSDATSGVTTSGFLNDRSLPAYTALDTGGTWDTKTWIQITEDINQFTSLLYTRSGSNVDALRDRTTLAVASEKYQYLSKTNEYGISVFDWIKKTYPNMRVVGVPELNNASASADVVYLYADSVDDYGSTDGGAVFMQAIQAKDMLVGVARKDKGYLETHASALAGVFCRRPYAVTRFVGI